MTTTARVGYGQRSGRWKARQPNRWRIVDDREGGTCTTGALGLARTCRDRPSRSCLGDAVVALRLCLGGDRRLRRQLGRDGAPQGLPVTDVGRFEIDAKTRLVGGYGLGR